MVSLVGARLTTEGEVMLFGGLWPPGGAWIPRVEWQIRTAEQPSSTMRSRTNFDICGALPEAVLPQGWHRPVKIPSRQVVKSLSKTY